MALNDLTAPDPGVPWFDPATGKPTPEFARFISLLVSVVRALRTNTGV